MSLSAVIRKLRLWFPEQCFFGLTLYQMPVVANAQISASVFFPVVHRFLPTRLEAGRTRLQTLINVFQFPKEFGCGRHSSCVAFRSSDYPRHILQEYKEMLDLLIVSRWGSIRNSAYEKVKMVLHWKIVLSLERGNLIRDRCFLDQPLAK